MGVLRSVSFVAVVGALWICGFLCADSGKNFGDVLCGEVLAVEDDYTLRCRVDQWPAVIGEDIPVRIDGVESLGIYEIPTRRLEEIKQNIQLFLEQQVQQGQVILLRDIRRGRRFELVARVVIDGQDLAELLVSQRLARRGDPVGSPPGDAWDRRSPDHRDQSGEPLQDENDQGPPPGSVPTENETKPAPNPEPARQVPSGQSSQQQEQVEYVASKSSRVFHRGDCPYARTIDEKNVVRFASRQEAVDSGRRPCKKCEP